MVFHLHSHCRADGGARGRVFGCWPKTTFVAGAGMIEKLLLAPEGSATHPLSSACSCRGNRFQAAESGDATRSRLVDIFEPPSNVPVLSVRVTVEVSVVTRLS